MKKQIFNFQFSIFKKNGFTLIEVLVGVALLGIVFSGIFAAYRLGMKVAGINKARISATSIASARIEMIRNLAYEFVGVENAELPFAAGTLEQFSSQTIDNTEFAVLTQVRFVSDAADGMGALDPCNLDFKKADVVVSWQGSHSGSVTLSTNVSPKNRAQEAQSCLDQPGGVLTVTVFDEGGILVPSPNISVYDPVTDNLVAAAIPASGKYSFPLASGNYRVEVSKTAYSSARTYSAGGDDGVAVPDSPNPTVLEGGEVPLSLSIDQAATIIVDGIAPDGQNNFADSFDDAALISTSENIQFSSGDILLSGPAYPADGYVISNAINPADLAIWDELRFSDTRPAGTRVFYQVLYYDGAAWILIPDSDLSGNSVGFGNSPVNLAGLGKSDYPQIKIKGNLASGDPDLTPRMHNWQVVWTTATGPAVAGAAFHIRGTKTIGEDSLGLKIYKYSQDQILDGAGHLDITGVDADAYTFSVDPASGMSLIATDPAQPINVAAGGTAAVKLFLRPQNALLVTVQNAATLDPVFSAEVRLSNSGIGYDKIRYTDQNGQTYFAPLDNGTYDIFVNAAGYAGASSTVSVAGLSDLTVDIDQNE
ncbi:MAG: prepilin-type N-terminal cleavage/methylation domain-containing protein [Minisyncoccales bacterium]